MSEWRIGRMLASERAEREWSLRRAAEHVGCSHVYLLLYDGHLVRRLVWLRKLNDDESQRVVQWIRQTYGPDVSVSTPPSRPTG